MRPVTFIFDSPCSPFHPKGVIYYCVTAGLDTAVDEAGDVWSRHSLDRRPLVSDASGLLSF